MNTGQTRKYAILTHILDEYVREGKGVRQRSSLFDDSSEERQNQARARAFIHLYLAATYGILSFEDRELTITDGSYDGGIDAYHIDTENKVLDIIQSKFRVGSSNFESKNISPEEILSIDLNRILNGHRESADGHTYNGRILAFIEKLQKVPDIARYKTRVTILANVKAEQYALVERLFHGDETNIVNFDRCYGELVMPTIRSEQHYTSSMRLQIDLSNKSNSSRLSAEIITAHGPSEVTVVLVPTIEIARIMSRYKNSILRYNPRSYLEFREQRTNEGIPRARQQEAQARTAGEGREGGALLGRQAEGRVIPGDQRRRPIAMKTSTVIFEAPGSVRYGHVPRAHVAAGEIEIDHPADGIAAHDRSPGRCERPPSQCRRTTPERALGFGMQKRWPE